MTNYHITYVADDTVLPKPELVSAAFLIAFDCAGGSSDGAHGGAKMLAIENDRGWDIPGGHVEEGETAEEALAREVLEEAGATYENAKLFAIVGSDDQDAYRDKVMLMYVADNFTLGTFTPSEDAFGREVMGVNGFFERYKGASDVLATLVPRAESFAAGLSKHAQSDTINAWQQ